LRLLHTKPASGGCAGDTTGKKPRDDPGNPAQIARTIPHRIAIYFHEFINASLTALIRDDLCAKSRDHDFGMAKTPEFRGFSGTFSRFDKLNRFDYHRGEPTMLTNTARQSVPSPEENVLTVQEALEPLFLALEEEAEVRMIAAALKAGWSAEEAVAAIDELRLNELLPAQAPH
jgi:hypothetical protein